MEGRSLKTEVFWAVWHLLVTALVGLLPFGVAGVGVRSAPGTMLELATIATVAYIILALLLIRRRRISGTLSLRAAAPLLIGCLAGMLLVGVARPAYSLDLVLLAVGAVLSGALLYVLLVERPAARVPSLVAVVAGLVLVGVSILRGPGTDVRLISTAAYDLFATYVRAPFTSIPVTGGALSTFGTDYLLATGDGTLYGLRWDDEEGSLESWELPHRVPINRDEFEAQHPNDVVKNGRFRIGDILVEEQEAGFRLFVSHHYWHDDRGCFTVRISETSGEPRAFLEGLDPAEWAVVYETEPCLPYSGAGVFGGLHLGGRMELFGEGGLLIAVGDHRRDGVVLPQVVAQRPDYHYGKTVVVDLANDTSFIYSRGHRNPQGLHLDEQGTVWLTEHGPQGGDELNLIHEGGNFGWPLVTYGTDYNQRVWPLNREQGRHTGFDEPVYAWIPSIGVTSVTRVEHPSLAAWQGDLLIGSLGDKAIWRVRLIDSRIVSMERIPVGARIRDLLVDRDGRLLMWTEGSFTPRTYGAIVVLETTAEVSPSRRVASDVMRGQIGFAAQCAGCHSTTAGTASLAPDLHGVVGRRVAAPSTGFTYSPALQAIPGNWTESSLDEFLSNPQAFAPGTTMESDGITDAGQRADLIAFLRSLR